MQLRNLKTYVVVHLGTIHCSVICIVGLTFDWDLLSLLSSRLQPFVALSLPLSVLLLSTPLLFCIHKFLSLGLFIHFVVQYTSLDAKALTR